MFSVRCFGGCAGSALRIHRKVCRNLGGLTQNSPQIRRFHLDCRDEAAPIEPIGFTVNRISCNPVIRERTTNTLPSPLLLILLSSATPFSGSELLLPQLFNGAFSSTVGAGRLLRFFRQSDHLFRQLNHLSHKYITSSTPGMGDQRNNKA